MKAAESREGTISGEEGGHMFLAVWEVSERGSVLEKSPEVTM